MGIVLLCEMVQRVTSHGSEATSHDRVKEAMRRLKLFRRADLEVAGRIGRGAYGGVWQATILENKTEVVVKVVFPDPDLDPEDARKARPSEEKLSSFRREIEVMSLLQHPNITAILGITSDSRVLVLEEAITDLHQMIKRQKRSLSLPAVRRWSRELLDGVQYLHSIKVIHRDLKPSNLLIFKDMTLKLGDFGLAREAAPTEMLPVRREICTLWYRAPELVMGDESYCSKIDVWSAGCIMLEMLVGRCATAGRVEDVCKCPKSTHFNYNGDQLAKIFRLVGTPTDAKLLDRMHCLHHFQTWPAYPPRLDEVVSGTCSAQRLGCDANIAAEFAKHWTECLSAMLQINPESRLCASEISRLPIWKLSTEDTGSPMPVRTPSLAGDSSSSRARDASGSENERPLQCTPPLASHEKPKALSLRNTRHSYPSSQGKVALQPLQPDHETRRASEPLLSLRTTANKDVELTARRPLTIRDIRRNASPNSFDCERRACSSKSVSNLLWPELFVSGAGAGGGSIVTNSKGPVLARAKSINSAAPPVVRMWPGGAYGKYKLGGSPLGHPNVLLDAIG